MELFDEAPSRLAKLCRGGGARAIALVPLVHSPTGRVRSAPALRAMAGHLDALGLPVIEDGTVADLPFRGHRRPLLAALCRRAPVISVESVSKVGWGGLRVGWLRAGAELVERTALQRGAFDFGTSVPSQLLALHLLADYDALIARRREVLASRAAVLHGLLAEHLPDWVAVRPHGGLSMWVDIGQDATSFTAAALRHGVTVAPGTTASRGEVGQTHLRLCFDRPHLELEAGVRALRRTHEDLRGWR